ncbi:hypothetical protein AAF712_010478 [Marasmius tenuissimus]|uniref:Arylamine N-acetyltransferase n=1 Tax=Marasmius tenuissimus TaxID=585030 RepID=A0ABR2ZNK9_9AGAR
MDVTPDGNFQRMVVERKGSYCYGKNGMLLEMLRGVGYRAYGTQGRVNKHSTDPEKEPEFTPLVHLVLLVQPVEGKGERQPILSTRDLEEVVLCGLFSSRTGLPRREGLRQRRLSFPKVLTPVCSGFASGSDNPAMLSWRLEVQHQKDPEGPPAPWKSGIEQSSYFVATHPNGSSFLQQVVCVKYVYLDDQKEDLSYTTLWRDHMRQHMGAQTKDLPEIKTEWERLETIREFHGIDVGEGAIEHIKGRNAALKAA